MKRKKERKEGEEKEPCEPNSLSLMTSKSRYSHGQKKFKSNSRYILSLKYIKSTGLSHKKE